MKRILLVAITLFISQLIVNGQSTCPPGINENFDAGNVFTSTGTPGWTIDNSYFVSSANSIVGRYGQNGFSELTSQNVSTVGSSVVILKFKHICKLNSFDGGIIQVDTGTGWIQLDTSNSVYTGSAITFTPSFGYSFKALSYPLLWQPSNDLAVPTNGWWKQESFDITKLCSDKANVRIRFQAGDGGGTGMNGDYGWLIDDIQFCYSSCELTPPVIVPQPPLLSGVVYTPGPYTVCFDMYDTSTVVNSELYFNLNGTGFQPTFSMQQVSQTQWCGQIPVTMVQGDTIVWYVEGSDMSCNFNVGTYPLSGYSTFWYSSAPEPPFCDYFDSPGQFWTDSSASGSSWQLGTPNSGFTNSPLTFPNSWDIDLNSGYLNGSNCFLTSKDIDFSHTFNGLLNVWLNYDTEDGVDGARLQYSTNGGSTWNTLGAVGTNSCQTNWYEGTITGGPGWSGQSNGWTPSTYRLACVPAISGAPAVRFRFVFRSDNFTNTISGFSIDNFCITKPAEQDFGVIAITSPAGGVPANSVIPVTVTIENFGNATQTSVTLIATISQGGPPTIVASFPWNGNLIPGSQTSVTIPNITVPSGVFTLCVYTVLAGDTIPANDTSCVTLLGIPTLPLSYSDDFEGPANWYAEADPTSLSNWELGTPAFGATNSAHSPITAWDVDLASGYTDNALCFLYSPYFDFQGGGGAINPQLIFWQNFSTILDNDGVTLQYTTNNGQSWNTLGNVNDSNATNWYGSASIFSSGLPGWSGISGGWIRSTYDLINVGPLAALPPKVQFTLFSLLMDLQLQQDIPLMIFPLSNQLLMT